MVSEGSSALGFRHSSARPVTGCISDSSGESPRKRRGLGLPSLLSEALLRGSSPPASCVCFIRSLVSGELAAASRRGLWVALTSPTLLQLPLTRLRPLRVPVPGGVPASRCGDIPTPKVVSRVTWFELCLPPRVHLGKKTSVPVAGGGGSFAHQPPRCEQFQRQGRRRPLPRRLVPGPRCTCSSVHSVAASGVTWPSGSCSPGRLRVRAELL